MKLLAVTSEVTRRFLLPTAAAVATLSVATASQAGMIILTYEEASGATGILGTSSSGGLTGGRFIGPPSGEFSPFSYAIRGQPEFLDTGVLFNEGLEASIFAITDFGYQGTLTVYVTYFDTLADPGKLNLISVFDVGTLPTGWSLTIENYRDPTDSPFPATTIPIGSEVFTTDGSATEVAAFDHSGGFFSLSTIFRIDAPTSGFLTATARITAEEAGEVAAPVPEPTSLAILAGALAAFVPWAARHTRRASPVPTLSKAPGDRHACGA